MRILTGRSFAAAALVVALVTAIGSAQQTPSTSCAVKLIPCQQYLNSSSPPASCCDSLSDAVKNELSCLCALFASPNILKAFNVSLAEALLLPVHCGLTSDTSVCAVSPAGATGTPGNNVGRGASWMGASGLASLVLFWWPIISCYH